MAQVLARRPQPELRSYNPGLRDRVAGWLMDRGPNTVGRRNLVGGLLGSLGAGSTGSPGLLDFTPIGGLLAFGEAVRSGDVRDAALAVMPGGVAARAARRAERFTWPVRTAYGSVVDMPITVNPSRFDIARELAKAPHGDVRALRAPNGDLYLWPANEAMHVDIADNFDLPFKTRQELQAASYLINKKDVDAIGKFKDFDDLIARLNALSQ